MILDILHVNTSIYPHIVKIVKEFSEVKVITHIRELIKPPGNWLFNYFVDSLSKSNHLICISKNEKKPFINRNVSTTVLPNPFDFSDSRMIQNNLYFTKEEGVVYIGMMGAFTKMKGQLLFLKIAHELIITSTHKFKFIIIGYTSKNKSLIKRIGKALLASGLQGYF